MPNRGEEYHAFVAAVRRKAQLTEGFTDGRGLKWVYVGPLGKLLVPETLPLDRWEALMSDIMAWQATLIPEGFRTSPGAVGPGPAAAPNQSV